MSLEISTSDLFFNLLFLDMALVKEVLELDRANMTETDAMNKFYWLISFPLQGVCRYTVC